MNFFDAVVLFGVVVAAIGGYRLGFVARVASWLGLALGLILGARVLPAVLEGLPDSSRGEAFLIAGAILVGGAFIGQLFGMIFGSKLRIAIPPGPARSADRAVGAGAGALGILLVVWLLLPALAETPGFPAQQVRGSRVARAIDERFPRAPDAAQTLRALVGGQSPRVFDALREAPDVGPTPASMDLTTELAAAVAESSVKIQGPACSRIQEGSGFVVAPDLVVTNAHVVAGEDSTTVQRLDGSEVDAQVVAFDPNRDLAVLRAPGLERPALALGESVAGAVGAAFGYPGGGDLRVAPFQVADVVTATGTDIYDSRRTEREVLFLAAALAPGDSGAALVDGVGEVVGVAFAIAPDRPGVAYGLSVGELQAVLAGDLSAPVATGPCVR
ncbi:MarP family serine protease [soil metagenome]